MRNIKIMTPDKMFVTVLGVMGIVFTYWFFLRRKETAVMASDSIDILVDGGYKPEVIEIPANKETKLNFTRKDSNSCLEDVALGDFKIKKYLPLNETVTITLNPKKTGTFQFSCGMGMFHGKLIVK